MADEEGTMFTGPDQDSKVNENGEEELSTTRSEELPCDNIENKTSENNDSDTGSKETTVVLADNGTAEIEDEADDAESLDPDQADKFKLKKFLGCVVKKYRPKDEDKQPYGFSEFVNDNDDDENVESVKHEGRKSNSKVEKKSSMRKALENPVSIGGDNAFTNISSQEEKQASSQKRCPDPYPCQTNVQRHVNPKSPRSIVRTDDDLYDFTYPERGYAVTIINDRFRRQTNRDGAHLDLMKIKEVSRKLGFRLFNYGKERNLSKAEILKLLRKVQQQDHSKCDCFLFMISTHGLEQPNVQANGKPDHALVCADDQLIFTSSILEMFNDENCPSLRNKPKLFFIQACRGENLDHGSDMFVAFPKRSYDVTDVTRLPLVISDSGNEHESKRQKKPSVDEADTKHGPGTWSIPPPYTVYHSASAPLFYTPKVQQTGSKFPHIPSAPSMHINKIYAPTPYAISDTPSLRCSNDMLVMYAIPEGMFAWRNTSDGSWMIDYLHQVIMAHDMTKPKSLLSLLTKVSAIMSRRTTNTPSSKSMDRKKAIPVIEHKLTKDVIFQQKVPMPGWVR